MDFDDRYCDYDRRVRHRENQLTKRVGGIRGKLNKIRKINKNLNNSK